VKKGETDLKGLIKLCEIIVADVKADLDRTFREVIIGQEEDGLAITIYGKDSGLELMTVRDVASRLKTDVDTVRRLTKERAKRRRDPLHSLPSYTLQGKMIRFKRSEVDVWIKRRESKAARQLTKGDNKTVLDSQFSLTKRMSQSKLTRLVTTLETNLEPSKNIKILVDKSETTEKIIANVLADVLIFRSASISVIVPFSRTYWASTRE
jgi:excisionase family DNA binding protein